MAKQANIIFLHSAMQCSPIVLSMTDGRGCIAFLHNVKKNPASGKLVCSGHSVRTKSQLGSRALRFREFMEIYVIVEGGIGGTTGYCWMGHSVTRLANTRIKHGILKILFLDIPPS